MTYLRKAQSLRPDVLEFQENYARSLEESGQTNEGIAAYHKLTSKHPDQANGWTGLGHLYYKSKKYGQAAMAFQKSLSIKQDQPEVLVALGQAQVDEGKLADAIGSSKKP